MDNVLIGEALSRFGLRPLDYSTTSPRILKHFEVYEKNARNFLAGVAADTPAMPPINFAFVDDSRLNASAFRHKDQYFITVNTGALVIFQILFLRIFSEPALLQGIEFSSEETDGLPTLSILVPDAQSITSSLSTLIQPRSQARRDAAEMFRRR